MACKIKLVCSTYVLYTSHSCTLYMCIGGDFEVSTTGIQVCMCVYICMYVYICTVCVYVCTCLLLFRGSLGNSGTMEGPLKTIQEDSGV